MPLRTLLFGLCVFLLILETKSQPKEFIIPAFSSINNVGWRDSVYLLNQFVPGELIFDTGFKAPQKHLMNYNLFTTRMDVISPKGDTAALEMIALPHTVRMSSQLFYFLPKKGYMRVLESGKVSLATFDYFNVGYLIQSGSGYSAKKNREQFIADTRKQPDEYDRSYIKQNELYFLAGNKFYRALKPGLLKAYKENKKEVKLYIKKHPPDFSNSYTLSMLIRSLNELTNHPENKNSDHSID